jgi:hypothetical protein
LLQAYAALARVVRVGTLQDAHAEVGAYVLVLHEHIGVADRHALASRLTCASKAREVAAY